MRWRGPRAAWACVLVLAGIVTWQQLSRRLLSPADALRLLGMLSRFETAAEAGDAEALLALFHDDAEHFGLTSGRLVQGREALARLLARELAGDAGSQQVETRVAGVHFVRPTVVLADVTVVYRDYRLGDRVWPLYREHSLAVASRVGGAWRLAATGGGGDDPSR